MKKRLLALFLMAAVMTEVQPVLACTSVIVSGKATKDGRPLIFKNRDTSTLHNLTIVVQGSRYRYIGLVNAEDTAPVNVWGGHNEAGFGIINTAAYNLNGDGGDTDGDGILIRKALELCATLEDFERLLDTVNNDAHQFRYNRQPQTRHGCGALLRHHRLHGRGLQGRPFGA